MNVLSLFDGISCGRVALDRAGIKVDKYYASEVDEYALKVSKKNYPNTIHLGSVTNVDVSKLPKIDLLIGGSPCQSFSACGGMAGFSGESSLFWEYVRVLNDLKKKNKDVLFLLENVITKKEWIDEISKALGVQPIMINSSLVSAQRRKRLYWTNIPNVSQPKEKEIYLNSVLEEDVSHKYFYSEKSLICLDIEGYKKKFENFSEKDKLKYYVPSFAHKKPYKIFVDRKKSLCLTANYNKLMPINYNRSQGQLVFDRDGVRRLTPLEFERLQTLPDNYTDGISNTQRYKAVGNGWTVDVIAHIFKNI